MKVLLDACVTDQVLPLLSSFDVKTAREQGWHELSNGKLLSIAQTDFDVLITLDRNMRYQQPIHKFEIGLIVIQGVRNTVESIGPKISDVTNAILSIKPGQTIVIA